MTHNVKATSIYVRSRSNVRSSTKMTGETPEVRSDKGIREKKE